MERNRDRGKRENEVWSKMIKACSVEVYGYRLDLGSTNFGYEPGKEPIW